MIRIKPFIILYVIINNNSNIDYIKNERKNTLFQFLFKNNLHFLKNGAWLFFFDFRFEYIKHEDIEIRKNFLRERKIFCCRTL